MALVYKLNTKIGDRLWLGACLALSAALQLSFISRSSVWHDEGYSLVLAPQNIGDILTRTARDVHPPLYYLVLHFWMGLFGSSELAVRSLSTLCIALCLAVTFALIKRLFGIGPARTAALLMAGAPFLIRYGQEARMYAMVAFLVAWATYLVVSALDLQSRRRLYLYGVVMCLALYTHYYAIFIIPLHWLYVLMRTSRKRSRPKASLDLKSWHWWGANALLAVLFAPWVPIAYAQFTRVQGGFWIAPAGLFTLPNSLSQFLFFDSWTWAAWLRLGLGGLFVVLVALALALNRLVRRSLVLLVGWALLPPLMVFVVSLVARPIYVDRYFVYSATAFYALLGCLFYLKPLSSLARLRPLLIIGLLVLFSFGIRNVYRQSSHQMRQLEAAVQGQFNAGDGLVAGELYVYLDFSYYNHTGTPLVLYAPAGISGYGETSLLYDKADELSIRSWDNVHSSSGYVWVIGKAGVKDYYQQVPPTWQLTVHLQAGESVANRYYLSEGLPVHALGLNR